MRMALRVGNLDKPVSKAPRQFTRLREFSRIQMTLVGDVVRAQARIKSSYRSRGIFVTGVNVYAVPHRDEWPGMSSFAPIQVNLTECLLSDIAENAVSFSYRQRIYFYDPNGIEVELIEYQN
jgi:hypothetical protein